MAGEDFVLVQLTEYGKKIAGGKTLHYSSGRRSFDFVPDAKPLRVERHYEWNVCLAHTRRDGQLLFELAPEPAAAGTLTKKDKAAAPAATDDAQPEAK